MKASIFFTALVLLYSQSVLASIDYGSVKGNITATDGQPLQSASVILLGTEKGTVTNTAGEFELNNIAPGSYSLEITLVGYEQQVKKITVHKNAYTVVEITLHELHTHLQAVEITGRKENSYKNDRSFAATKVEMAIKDMPQSVSTITKELMQDQQAFRTGDVVKNVSGVNQFSGYDDYTLRGFRGRIQLLNGLKTVTGFWTQPLLVNIEKVEVVKGPAAALFGNTDPGGTINRVTKKPLDVDRKSFSFTVGSFQTYRGTVDLTGPINKSKTVLYRLNLGYESSETFKTLQASESFIISPSLSFVPNEKTRVNMDLVYSYSNGKLYRGQPIFGATAGTQLSSTPVSFAIGRAGDYLKEKNFSANLSLSHQFSSNFSFNLSYLKYLYDENLMEHRTSNNYASDSAGMQIATLMEMQTIRRLSKKYNDNLTAYFLTRFNTGALQHQLLIGYDFSQFSVPVGGSSETARGYKLKNGKVANTYNKNKKGDYMLDANGNPVPNVPHFNLVKPDYSLANTSAYVVTSLATAPARNSSNGIYMQDNIKWNRFSLLLGLRKEFFSDRFSYKTTDEKNIRQQSFIPRVGLVYNLTRSINLYGTYVQGFMPQNTASMANPNVGGPFDPLISRMYEAGAKGDFLNRRLSATLAVYHLEQNNVLVNANNPGNPDSLVQRGQERGRGIELDVNGRISDNFYITANYTYSKAIISKSTDKSMEGQLKENAPLQQGGAWLKYYIVAGKLKGIGVAAGSNFVTKRKTFSSILELPGYAVADAALYYRFEKVQLSLNLNNVFNKTYWTGGYDFNRLYPGAPRNFLATIFYTL